MISSDIFARAFEGAGIGLLLLDKASGRIIEANRTFRELCGRSRAEIVGQVFWQPPLVADAEAGAAAAAILLEGARLQGAELPLATADGRLVLLEVAGREQAGSILLLEVVDAGAREHARLAERMDAQRSLAVGAAGEFAEIQRALLAARERFDDSDAVERAAQRAGSQARDLLAFGEQLTLHPEPVELNELIEAMHLSLQRRLGPDIEVQLNLDPLAPAVFADPAEIRQILTKLAARARDTMPQGVLRIETRNADADDPTTAGAAEGASFVILAVSDNGPGLDDEAWAHLYEPFCPAGLAALHGVVRQSGGRLWSHSAPGEGTAFRIYLPRAAGAAPSRPAILVMEPNNGLRDAMSSILRKRGYRVLTAPEGQAALAIVNRQGAPGLLISRPETRLPEALSAHTLFVNGQAASFDLDAFLGKVRELLPAQDQ